MRTLLVERILEVKREFRNMFGQSVWTTKRDPDGTMVFPRCPSFLIPLMHPAMTAVNFSSGIISSLTARSILNLGDHRSLSLFSLSFIEEPLFFGAPRLPNLPHHETDF